MISKIKRHLSNVAGWRTSRKIVVFESDDWGSIRIPSAEAYNKLLSEGIDVDKNHFTKYDSLERNEDLELLFEVLRGLKDSRGNNPIFTALCIVANPDFDKIRQSEFSTYYLEPLYSTLEKYDSSTRVVELWKEGNSLDLFKPEFHGREHVNISRWMTGLQSKLPNTRKAFDLGLSGIHSNLAHEDRGDYQAAFDIDEFDEIEKLKVILEDGINRFSDILGYNASYFCPPNGPFPYQLEDSLYSFGIKYLNLPKIRPIPPRSVLPKIQLNYLGKKLSTGPICITRNAFFEPCENPDFDWVDYALEGIQSAFHWSKPAVVSSHRVNYVGRLDSKMRDHSLEKLKNLVERITRKWPDVEFMSSTELGRQINSEC